jgi:hypothetical protein
MRKTWIDDRRLPLALLGGGLVASAALLLYLGRNFTFIQDTWPFLLNRRGSSLDDFLAPHNEHIVAIPVVIEKVLISIFGMSTAWPERIVLTAMLLGTAALVFVYVRRRAGGWLALFAAVLLLFLGPSWSVLLWPFEIVIVGSVMTGVAMLLLLEREDRRGDILACLMLVLSVGFASLGISFIVAAAVEVLLQRQRRGVGRVWIPLVPALLFAAWYLGWGHVAESHLSLDNVLSSPVYLFEGVANSLASLLGLSTIDVNDVGRPEWGRPLLVAAIALVVYGQSKRRGFSPRLWPVLAALASYWIFAGFNETAGRSPVAGRYGYAGAVFVLLVAADLLRGVRLSRNAIWIGCAVTLVAVASNLVFLRQGRDWLENLSVLTQADTAGIEIASRTVAPEFYLSPEVAGTGALISINAGQYLDAVREHGSPAYTPEELAAAPEYARRQADIVIAQALPLSTEVVRGPYRPASAPGCVNIGSRQELRLSPGVATIEAGPGPDVEISLRRFATESFPVVAADAAGNSRLRLRIVRDEARQPWFLSVEASQPVRVCP